MKSDTLKKDIEDLKAELEPKQILLGRLERDYRDALSREFIAAHNITTHHRIVCFILSPSPRRLHPGVTTNRCLSSHKLCPQGRRLARVSSP